MTASTDKIDLPPLALTAVEELVFHCAVADFLAFQEARRAVLKQGNAARSLQNVEGVIAAMHSFVRKVERLRCSEVVVAYAPPSPEGTAPCADSNASSSPSATGSPGSSATSETTTD